MKLLLVGACWSSFSEGWGDPAMHDLLEQSSCFSWGPPWFSFSEGRGDPAMRDLVIFKQFFASGGDQGGSVYLRVGVTQPCMTLSKTIQLLQVGTKLVQFL